MKFYSLVCAMAVVVAAFAAEAQAQTILYGDYGPVVQPTVPAGGVIGTPAFAPGYAPGFGVPAQTIYPGRVSGPVYVTPTQFNGYNPQTGGWDTRNSQVNNTYYDYGRDASRYNGTSQYVRRPVYNSAGQVVGYEQGEVWRNTYTGQEHGNLKTYTPNNTGGVQETAVFRSTAAPKK